MININRESILNLITKDNHEYITPWDFNNKNFFYFIPKIERFIKNCCNKLNIKIEYGDDGARYYPFYNKIGMPYRVHFQDTYEYYRIIFHELTHSVGNKCECFRDYYDDDSFEELVAEINALHLMNYFNIDNQFSNSNSISYCKGWFVELMSEHSDWQDLIVKIKKEIDISYNYLIKIGEENIN